MTPTAPLIDPTPEELAARLDAAAGSPGRAWGEVLNAILGRPDGVVTVTPAGGDSAVRIGWEVSWWLDRLGRRHWGIGTGSHGPPLGGTPTAAGDYLLWWHHDHHPLEWIAPPLASGWRERGGKREFVVICRCGVVGSPEVVAWMGQACGPCSEREQDGRDSGADAAGEIGQLLLTPSGRFLVVRRSPFDLDAPDQSWTRLTVHDGPREGPPRWERSWPGYCIVAGSDALVAVRNKHGELELLDTEDGSPLRTFRTGELPISHVEFAGPGRGILVTLDFFRVRFWDVHGPASWPSNVGRLASISFGPFAAHPDGTRVTAFTGSGAEVYDVASGTRIDRLEVSGQLWGQEAAYLHDGSLCLSDATSPDRWRLCRWGPSAPPSFLATLFGRKPRRPDRERDIAPAVLRATDGRRLLTTGIADPSRGTPPTTLVDGATLTPIASFTPGRGLAPEVAAFAGGVILVGHGSTLAVWPLREVFGVESHHDAFRPDHRPDAAAARRATRHGGGIGP